MSLVAPNQTQIHTFKELQSKFISIIRPFDEVSNFKSWLGEIRKEYYDNSDISNELEFKEKYKKLDKSIDPAFYSKGSMHPDIIIYSFNDNNEYKPIKKIKPPK